MVIFIYRPEVYQPRTRPSRGIAEVNVAKQRNGPTDILRLAFFNKYARFANADLDFHYPEA